MQKDVENGPKMNWSSLPFVQSDEENYFVLNLEKLASRYQVMKFLPISRSC